MYLQKELRDGGVKGGEGSGQSWRAGDNEVGGVQESWRVVKCLHAQSLFTLHQAAAETHQWVHGLKCETIRETQFRTLIITSHPLRKTWRPNLTKPRLSRGQAKPSLFNIIWICCLIICQKFAGVTLLEYSLSAAVT